MKWLVLHLTILLVLFAAQATHQDDVRDEYEPTTRAIDIELFTHDVSLHMLSDLDNNFSQVSKKILLQFREQSSSVLLSDPSSSCFVSSSSSSSSSSPASLSLSLIDLPLLKNQVMGAAESLIGDKLSAVWNMLDTKSLLHRHIQQTTRHVCPDLTHLCMVENEDTVKRHLDNYIHRHLSSTINHLLEDYIPHLFQLAQEQATQVLSLFFQHHHDACLFSEQHDDDSIKNNTIIWHHPTTTTNTIPFVFHHHTATTSSITTTTTT
ncbi:hypothetical protein BDB00DRAFT_874155 [Zychaea mexicana]|uniref:uncharacterized protein n=1 Tax=Zychaea mexicana TaxID=64656 RepID=UPI0022FDB7B1|nr:uncharacterized protein BDB00DRAFT_874155 [Zychaea mexicana]KAI9491592.1 hypothetical protein BDB00DRAFT_874155 [Zychaea mexicana]